MLRYLLFPVSDKIETFFANHAKDILKPRVAQQPRDNWFLLSSPLAKRNIETHTITSGERKLTAHQLTLGDTSTSGLTLPQKKIIYMAGNCPFIEDSLPTLEPVLRKMIDALRIPPQQVTGYFQHYRGRGANQAHPQENFNDYPLRVDAIDQALLIKKIVAEGTKPEDIIVMGYSYGSAVAIWAIYYLICNEGMQYANVKFFSDRGFGNLFNHRYVKPLIYDQKKAHQRLYEKEMLPDLPLADIVQTYVPDSFIFHVAGDECIWLDYSLIASCTTPEMQERTLQGNSSDPLRQHLAHRDHLQLKTITAINPQFYIASMLFETPINLEFTQHFFPQDDTTQPAGYACRKNAKLGDQDFILLPECVTRATTLRMNNGALIVKTNIISELLGELHRYCLHHAERAANHASGANYNRAWFSSTGWTGWDVKTQINKAIEIMTLLCAAKGPDIAGFHALNPVGPQQSGLLQPIYQRVKQFMLEYQQLTAFNTWVSSMATRREMRHHASRSDLKQLNDWYIVTANQQPPLTTPAARI